jgi:fibronectin-binding autotransporter adhesin
VWELRNYADSDGDGTRDTESTASADFGGGTDSFTNSGTLRLSQVSSAGSIGQLINLESFTNSSTGVIDLSDDEANDRLSISGDFKSDGGSLELDVVLDDGSSPQADQLVLETVSMPNGNPTLVSINNGGGAGAMTIGNGILIIEADGDSSAGGAFTLADQVIAGNHEYLLYYDPTGFDWYLQSAAFEGTAEYPALVTAALMSWHSDVTALNNRLNGLRGAIREESRRPIEPAAWTGPSAPGTGPWFQLTTAKQEIDIAAPFAQTVRKLAGGFDGIIEGARGAHYLFGAFGGGGQTTQDFVDSTTKASTDMAFAGLYAGYQSGGFYGDAIAKFEHHWAQVRSTATDDEDTPFAADLLGLSLESGYRLALGRSYVQPHGGLRYARAWAGSFQDSSGTTVDLSNGQTLVGEAGVRFGTQLAAAPLMAELDVDAGIRHEFLGETEAVVSGLACTGQLPGTVGFVGTNLNVTMPDDTLKMGFHGSYAKGQDAEELSADFTLDVQL